MRSAELESYLAECRQLTLREIREIIPKQGRNRTRLYDLILEYPLRSAKALRPALCVATCRALGGHLESVLLSAAVLELYHNAFLIHDDVEDGSESRRDGLTLHRQQGVPIAVNVGDAMLALTLEPLLDNMRTLGLGKALRILQVVARMARESAEGQAIELEWVRDGNWHLSDADYVRMVYKKTSWYTFITPAIVGCIVAEAAERQTVALRKFASLLGIAFQMQDDILNLTAERERYGKEIDGDLWEGKHTVLLLHMMRTVQAEKRRTIETILAKDRPASLATAVPSGGDGACADGAALSRVLDDLKTRGDLSLAGWRAIRAAMQSSSVHSNGVKTAEEVQYLIDCIDECGSVPYASQVAQRWASKARDVFDEVKDWLEPSVHRDFLEGLVDFVVRRDH
jgi:geranylgeranyl diphosphate synthase type II